MNYLQFEDLPIWKKVRAFVKLIYDLSRNKYVKHDYGFKDQIQRAALSVMNNIAEGFERETNAEFVRYLYYSKGSAGEVRSMIYVAYDLNYITEVEFEALRKEANEIVKHIANFIKYLKTHKIGP